MRLYIFAIVIWFVIIYFEFKSISKFDNSKDEFKKQDDFINSDSHLVMSSHSLVDDTSNMIVFLCHEYVPYLRHHGADTRLFQLLKALQDFKEVLIILIVLSFSFEFMYAFMRFTISHTLLYFLYFYSNVNIRLQGLFCSLHITPGEGMCRRLGTSYQGTYF